MRAVQMTLDEDLVAQVDRAAARTGTTRSGFTREALRQALARLELAQREERHRRGYLDRPPDEEELSAWEGEQVWPT
ncbi:MAG: ribbon-helix-helix protein, CopG family [Candidatus Latescibacterota bacterium]